MRHVVTDFQLIRYIDTAVNELIAECGGCRHEYALDVADIISTHCANLWVGELRERLQWNSPDGTSCVRLWSAVRSC